MFSITEVKVVPSSPEVAAKHRLLAAAAIVIDEAFIVHDLKIIQARDGPFVGMPSRKRHDRCHACGTGNALTNRFCGACGAKLGLLEEFHRKRDLYLDIAHPLNCECRDMVTNVVLAEHERVLANGQGGNQRTPETDQ